VQNSLLPILANLIRLHDIDSASILYADDDPKWVDASTSALVLFHISVSPVITNYNLND